VPHPFVHIELATDDVGRAKSFYADLFGWKMTDMPMDYTLLSTGKAPGGGIFKRPPEAPAGWSVYVGVADAAATLERARGLGATVLRDRTLISAEFGYFAVIKDPTGAVICLHEPARAPAKKRAKRRTRVARRPPRKARR
jgi:uncharacterized protein